MHVCVIISLLMATALMGLVAPRAWMVRVLQGGMVATLVAGAMGLYGTAQKANADHRDPVDSNLYTVVIFGVILLFQSIGLQRAQRRAAEDAERAKLAASPASKV